MTLKEFHLQFDGPEVTTQECNELLQLARSKANWGPDLFKRFQAASVHYRAFPGIFNRLKQVLSEEDYFEFDLQYCDCIRLGCEEENEQLRCNRKKRKAEEWQQEKIRLLKRKKQLLTQKLNLLTNN